MADETAREEVKKKLLIDPNDQDTGIFIPCIKKIKFRDPKSDNQEFGFIFDNTGKAEKRKTHEHEVKHANADGTEDDDPKVKTQRVESFSMKDPKTNNQVTTYRIRNDDPPPKTPKGDDGGDTVRHSKVHYVRYSKDNDFSSDVWADFELVDEFEFQDPKEDSQRKKLRLRHPDPDSLPDVTVDTDDPYKPKQATCPTDLEEIPAGDGIDPPWQFDPFKALVNVSAGEDKGFVICGKKFIAGGYSGIKLSDAGVFGTVVAGGIGIEAEACAKDKQGNVFLGYVRDVGVPALTKYSGTGASLWSIIAGSGDFVNVLALDVDDQGNCYAAYQEGLDPPKVVKASSSGSIIWTKTLPAFSNLGVSALPKGMSIILTGSTAQVLNADGSNAAVSISGVRALTLGRKASAAAVLMDNFATVRKFNPLTGEVAWTSSILSGQGLTIDIAADGSVYVSGLSDLWIDKINPDGSFGFRKVTGVDPDGFGGNLGQVVANGTTFGTCVVETFDLGDGGKKRNNYFRAWSQKDGADAFSIFWGFDGSAILPDNQNTITTAGR